MTTKDDLDNNKTDLIASAAKSIVGVVPFGSSLLNELVSNLIPNQRIDRLTKYVRELNEKLSLIPIEKIKLLCENEYFIDLIEEGFVQASRAITDERKKYIASIISNGISENTVQLQESKYLLKILEEINDSEVIWLRFYYEISFSNGETFKRKHINILTEKFATTASDEEELSSVAIQDSYKEHLERLGLIEHQNRFNRSKGLPEFDERTGKPKITSSRITPFGRLLLKQIGLIDKVSDV